MRAAGWFHRSETSYSGSASKSHPKMPLVIITTSFLPCSSEMWIPPLFCSQVIAAIFITSLLLLLSSSPGFTTIWSTYNSMPVALRATWIEIGWCVAETNHFSSWYWGSHPALSFLRSALLMFVAETCHLSSWSWGWNPALSFSRSALLIERPQQCCGRFHHSQCSGRFLHSL